MVNAMPLLLLQSQDTDSRVSRLADAQRVAWQHRV